MKKIFTEKFFSRTSIVIIFLALIRLISEFFRLDFELKENLNISMIRPYMLGALVCSTAAFVMVLLNFFHKFKLVIACGILAIAALVYIKFFLL